jgi:hypothetical protein
VDAPSRIREYFADIPAMIEVARCESGLRQYRADGTVLFDPTGTWMGAFQLSTIHLVRAFELGMNITTLEGNMAYARHLYDEEGLTPWESSRQCWGSAVSATPNPKTEPMPEPPSEPTEETASSTAPEEQNSTDSEETSSDAAFSRPLVVGSTGPDVLKLQQMLNGAGFTIADSGPGSPGQETEMFGLLTQEAVRKFQCAQDIVCSGTPANGYGVFGPRTTAALVSYKHLSQRN